MENETPEEKTARLAAEQKTRDLAVQGERSRVSEINESVRAG